MTTKTAITLLISLLCPAILHAQENPAGYSEYRYDDLIQLWRQTNNAAGLGLDSTRQRGYAQIGYEHQSGDYHRVQEGSRTNQLRFETERYQKVGKYLYGFGRFDFDYGRLQERSWCDVRRPYHSNPFFPGSAIPGKYDFQDFNFTAALGSTDISGWRFGLRLDYSVGDLSRLRDPRSRSQLLDYKLTPAVTRTIGRHTVGLSGSYQRRKEKITGVTTLQSDAIITYYTMSGLENAEGVTSGYKGYGREWVNHNFGLEVSYGYHTQAYRLLAKATIERGTEYAYGQYKYEDGKFVDYRYGLSINNILRSGQVIHSFDAAISYRQAYADEYVQRYQTEPDKNIESLTYTYPVRQPDGSIKEESKTINKTSEYTSYYYTRLLTYKKRFQVKELNADVHYRMNLLCDKGIKGYIGARLTYDKSQDKHLLPDSHFDIANMDMTLEGGYALFGNRLWIEGSVTSHANQKADLQLHDPTTDYAQSVLIPDMAYYAANYWKGTLALTYQFPLTIKHQRTLWYAKIHGSYLHANKSSLLNIGDDSKMYSQTAGLSVGLYY